MARPTIYIQSKFIRNYTFMIEVYLKMGNDVVFIQEMDRHPWGIEETLTSTQISHPH